MSVSLYRLSKVRDLTGLSTTTIWRMEKANTFPKRRKISDRAVGWLASDIQEWIEQRQEVSDD